jgi:hypothetical protein
VDYSVEWSPEALEDIQSIAAYISRDSEYYARAVISKFPWFPSSAWEPESCKLCLLAGQEAGASKTIGPKLELGNERKPHRSRSGGKLYL